MKAVELAREAAAPHSSPLLAVSLRPTVQPDWYPADTEERRLFPQLRPDA
jgi:hypothetical protein